MVKKYHQQCRGVVETNATGGSLREVVDDDMNGAPVQGWNMTLCTQVQPLLM
jgi:hypothetical protein